MIMNKIGLHEPPTTPNPLMTFILLVIPEIKTPAPINKLKKKVIAIYFITPEVLLKSPFLKINPIISKSTPMTIQMFAVRAWSISAFILLLPSVKNGMELFADNIPPTMPDKMNIRSATADLVFFFATPKYPCANKSPYIA